MSCAQSQHRDWSLALAVHIALDAATAAIPDSISEPTRKAGKVVDLIDAYQPYDFKPGVSWTQLEIVWNEAEASYARTQALAALLSIRLAIEAYHES